MPPLLGGLLLIVNLAQVTANRPPDPLPAMATSPASCCAASAPSPPSPPPPPPQGTNRGLLTEPMLLTGLVDAIVSRSKNEGAEGRGPYVKFGAGVPGA